MLTYACFRARYYISSSFYFFLLFPNTHYMYNSPSDYSLFLLNLLLIQLLSSTTLIAVYICYYTWLRVDFSLASCVFASQSAIEKICSLFILFYLQGLYPYLSLVNWAVILFIFIYQQNFLNSLHCSAKLPPPHLQILNLKFAIAYIGQ